MLSVWSAFSVVWPAPVRSVPSVASLVGLAFLARFQVEPLFQPVAGSLPRRGMSCLACVCCMAFVNLNSSVSPDSLNRVRAADVDLEQKRGQIELDTARKS